MMTVSREAVAAAALVLIVDDQGSYRWSSDKTPGEVAAFLRGAARQIVAGKSRPEATP